MTVFDPNQLRTAVERAAGGTLAGELRFRPMFGGIMGYVHGKPFASLSDVGLALKLSAADRSALLAEPGARMLRYAPDQPESKSYVLVPPAFIGDPERLLPWLARSAEHVTAAGPSPRPSRRSATSARRR